MKICNIPRKATEIMVTKMLTKKIKNLKYEKIIVEMDQKTKMNKGIAWISSKDKFTLKQLIKLHYHVSAFLFFILNVCVMFLDLRQLQVNHLHGGLPIR